MIRDWMSYCVVFRSFLAFVCDRSGRVDYRLDDGEEKRACIFDLVLLRVQQWVRIAQRDDRSKQGVLKK